MTDDRIVPAQEMQFTETPHWVHRGYTVNKYTSYVRALRDNVGQWAKVMETTDRAEANRWRSGLRRYGDLTVKQFTRYDEVIEVWATCKEKK